jgi:hypothetical protein
MGPPMLQIYAFTPGKSHFWDLQIFLSYPIIRIAHTCRLNLNAPKFKSVSHHCIMCGLSFLIHISTLNVLITNLTEKNGKSGE